MAPQTNRILYVDFQPKAAAQTALKPKLRIVAPANSAGMTPKRNRFANPGQNPALTHALQNFRRRLQECEQNLAATHAKLEELQGRHKAIKAAMKASSHRSKAVRVANGGTVEVMRPVSGKQSGKKSWERLGSVREAIRAVRADKQQLTRQKFDLARDIQFLEYQRELQFQRYIDSLVAQQSPAEGADGVMEGEAMLDSGILSNKKAIV